MKAFLLFAALAASVLAAERIVVVTATVTPEPYLHSIEIRPRRIVIEYPDDAALDPVVTAIYERLTLRAEGTNAAVIIGRETARQVQLNWSQATAAVPALTNARPQFNAVFVNLFTQP